MNKILIASIMFFTLLMISCSKTEYVLNLSCNLSGNIITISEFGERLDEKDNVRIELDGSDPLLFAITDTSGAFVIENVPTGTYNYIISKEGYVEQQYQGIQILGGEDFNTSFYLRKKSETRPENLNMTFNETEQFIISCQVFHNIEPVTEFKYPAVTVFVDTTANVSFENAVRSFSLTDTVASGGTLEATLDFRYISGAFDSGDIIYARAYGGESRIYGYYYYDIETGNYVSAGFANPTDVFSITMP